jgi:hypothetical protein
MVFYFPHSRIWLLIKSTSAGHSRLMVRVIAPKAFNNTAALSELVSGIENKLKVDNDNQREVHHG